ncbi:MAG: transport system ATP-binding/permease protein [Solirubrobacteraceae bacterium]|nr:transport system ATP-binding/permease protein [Solirubrobacteraceae bacterium]
MAPARNLVNLNAVSKGYATRSVLRELTLGVSAGDRVGIVGRNGEGKSTLLALIAGAETPDDGSVVRARDLEIGFLGQGDELDGSETVRAALIGDRAQHEWAGDAAFRGVLAGLLGGVELSRLPAGLDTAIGPLSGGERRRIALAGALLENPDLLILDEPTNHLDVDAIHWLARHLAHRQGSVLVVTHDRWFLDAACTATWEVADETVHQYEGGYAAYMLARAERERQAAVRDDRRRQLIRKELAWLRRGPPARTAKPKFRIEAANALITDEPEVRDRAELLRFAGARLGDKVLEAVDVSASFGDRTVLDDVTLRLGPGDRVALLGANGSGKTTLLKLLAGELEPTRGVIERGSTVRLAHLTQDMTAVPGHLRVLESLEEVRGIATLSDGRELTAGSLSERFGFRGDRARTLVRDLSGGERRRVQLMRLLMAGPNVLLLDEPTNDLDIDTLTALEDLLDAWPGTLVVASHDRYFVERVADSAYAIDPDGGLRHLPGGVEQYLALRTAPDEPSPAPVSESAVAPPGAVTRAVRKEIRRLDAALRTLEGRESTLAAEMATHASDHARLSDLQAQLDALRAERDELETAWLHATETLEQQASG